MANIVHDSTEEENVRKFKRAISKSSNGYTTVGYSHLFRSSGLKKNILLVSKVCPKLLIITLHRQTKGQLKSLQLSLITNYNFMYNVFVFSCNFYACS